MRHYTSEEWADYVRGITPDSEKEKMKRHLESGCETCEEQMGTWTTILKLAQKETGYRPPDSAVRLAKSYYSMSRLVARQALVPRLARLVFDSFQQPQLAGVRSMGPAARHYVFRAGSIMVDVWMEPPLEDRQAALTGQILDHATPGEAVRGMLVKLRSASADLATTLTNQFGEFHLDLTPKGGSDVQLTIGNDQKVAVIIPLRLMAEKEAANGLP